MTRCIYEQLEFLGIGIGIGILQHWVQIVQKQFVPSSLIIRVARLPRISNAMSSLERLQLSVKTKKLFVGKYNWVNTSIPNLLVKRLHNIGEHVVIPRHLMLTMCDFFELHPHTHICLDPGLGWFSARKSKHLSFELLTNFVETGIRWLHLQIVGNLRLHVRDIRSRNPFNLERILETCDQPPN